MEDVTCVKERMISCIQEIKRDILTFIDINNSDVSLVLKHCMTYHQAMEILHALKSDCSIIMDIKFFKRLIV